VRRLWPSSEISDWTKTRGSCTITSRYSKRLEDGELLLANIKSQLKRNRQNEKRRVQNRVYRGSARRAINKAREALDGENVDTARALTMEAVSQLDHAAGKGVLHRNNASRRKGRLMKALAALEKAKA
jgi:small subunit ribosomal protein S20